MKTYEVTQTHFFRENGQKVEAGQTTELSEETYKEYLVKHPGLLKPVRETTQGSPAKQTTQATPQVTKAAAPQNEEDSKPKKRLSLLNRRSKKKS